MAFGAYSLNITLLSGNISGDFGVTGITIPLLGACGCAPDAGVLTWAITDSEMIDIQNPVQTFIKKLFWFNMLMSPLLNKVICFSLLLQVQMAKQ
jgi:hypothetical protein